MDDEMSDITDMIRSMGVKAREAARVVACASIDQRNRVLRATARRLAERSELILSCNAKDIAAAARQSSAAIDRLRLDHQRLDGIHEALTTIEDQPDPLGVIAKHWSRPSGLDIRRVTTPLGVIGVIYESRPNVTIDAGALCVKSGNAVILRPGSDSFHTSQALHECLRDGLLEAGLPAAAVQIVPVKDRAAVGALLALNDSLDVIVPRGGRSLVERIQRDAKVPVFAHLEGICHVYVDAQADVEKARQIVVNAKTRRVGICSAAECVLVDHRFWHRHGAPFLADLIASGIEVRADPVLSQVTGTVAAGDQDFGCEFLDDIIAAKCVDGVSGAIDHIARHGSGHTDAIVTEDRSAVAAFFAGLESAILMHNASTQFADGGEFGMGGELGIATGKLHARGPIALRQLTSFKYLVEADCAVRP